ncbi:MAG: porin family protein [Candidatus Aminicenantes bacterium]|nr:porin family protein [Candidatus Aminicenantes bacterium]
MIKKIILSTVCGALFMAVASAPAQAQFYLGVRGGLSSQNAQMDEIKFDKNSAFLYGAQAGVKFLGLAVEGQFYRADHDLLGENPAMPEVEQEMSYYYLGVSGKLGISLAIVYPYVTVGYGTYSVNLKDLGKKSDAAFNAGAGVELTLGKIGIFGELRYVDFDLDIENMAWDFGGVDLHFGLNLRF